MSSFSPFKKKKKKPATEAQKKGLFADEDAANQPDLEAGEGGDSGEDESGEEHQ